MNVAAGIPKAVVAIDVETANPQGAICEFAAVAIDLSSGRNLFTVTSLIDPGDVEWNGITTSFHGLSKSRVRGAPALDDVWNSFLERYSQLEAAKLFAHNAAMDRSWLATGLCRPLEHEIYCTIALAKRTLPLPRYTLPAVCAALGIQFEETHRAEPDAEATAEVARRLLVGLRADTRAPSAPSPAPAKARTWTSNVNRGRNREIIATTARRGNKLRGRTVCITGQFGCGWTRKEAKAKIVSQGGTPIDDVSSSCDLLVIAGKTGPLTAADFSTEKARKAKSRGIEIVNETALLQLLAD
jgi:DNA polymerase III epsilon subunit-like protein